MDKLLSPLWLDDALQRFKTEHYAKSDKYTESPVSSGC